MNRNTLTTEQAAKLLNVSVSRIEQHCRNEKRPLGKKFGKFSGAWVITLAEIKAFRKVGKLPAGRPKKGTK
jgi:hypothetical protein